MEYLEREAWAVRVKRGVAWMDEHKPGWAKQIDTSQLRMSNDCHCILGQTCGSFAAALQEQFGIGAMFADGWGWALLHGFNAPSPSQLHGSEADVSYQQNIIYSLLAELWLPYVLERQQAGPVVQPLTTKPIVNVRELIEA